MKIKILLFFITLFQIQVELAYSQSTLISLNLKNSTVEEALNAIEEKSEFYFLYNTKLIDVDRKISIDVKNEPIQAILHELFDGTDVTFNIDNRQIVLSSKEIARSLKENVPEKQSPPRQLTGKIADEKGDGIIGASVSMKGTGTGTITDIEGSFSLNVPETGGVLLITFLGYKPQEISITDQSSVNVVLKEDLKALDEVVVIGYGTQKKSDLTGSVASVKMKTITDIPSNSIDGLLQGRAAGLQVMNTSQDPESGAVIRIRGNSSLNGSNTPLIVVNGFPLGDAGSLSQINPSNIESVEVLKDASASAIYGSRGANGVILITTKTAKEGITSVQIKHQTVISQLTDKVDVWYDPMLMAQVANEEQINAGLTPPYIGQTIGGIYYPSLMEIQSGKWSNTDWVDLCLRTPYTLNTTASVNSANDRSSFNLNASYWDDEGIYKKDSYKKFNTDISLSYKLLPNLTLSLFSVFSNGNRNICNNLNYGRSPLWPVYDENGNYFLAGTQDFGHPLIVMNGVKNTSAEKDFVNSFAAEWEILKGLKIRSQLNYRYKDTTGDVYQASTTSQDAYNNQGIAQVNITEFQSLLSETYLTWDRKFGDIHSLTVMVGHSYNWENNRGLYTTARGFVNDVLGNENMNASDPAKRDIYNDGYYVSRLLSYYGRLNYTLRDKYLFTFTMRADGSTKFGSNNKWGYFPSGAISWKLHNEPWLKDVRWLSELKLRASYGLSGNQGINSYQTLDRYGMEKFWNEGQWKTVIGPGYEVGRTGADNRYMVWGGIANPDLKWETTAQTDLGIDAAFFKNRLRLTGDVYYKKTTNLLREKYLTLSSSYDKMWVNEGEVLNKGFEISLDGDIVATKDWGVTAGINFSLNRNLVTNLGDPVSSGLSVDYLTGMYYEVTGPAISMFNQNASIYGIGKPMNVFYGYKVNGIIQTGEDPGFIDPNGLLDRPGELKYVDLNGDYAITPADRTVIGNPNPKFTAGFNFSTRWKNLDMAVTLYSVYGNDVLYNNYTFSPKVKSLRWTPDNPTNDYPRLNNNRQYLLSSYFIMDGSYLRIQNVNIGYNFKINKLLKSVRLFANIDNLYTFTHFNGFDPEVGTDGIYWGGYPKFRKYTMGIDVNF